MSTFTKQLLDIISQIVTYNYIVIYNEGNYMEFTSYFSPFNTVT